MTDEATPYISRNPGDLLSAEDWNQVQVDIKNDIAGQIQKAIGQIEDVPHADDTDKLDGKSLEDITKDIIQKVLEMVAQQAGGYQRLFRRIEHCRPEIFINHGLKACPLVDVYQLDYFLAVCAKGEMPEDASPAWVNFYLYHSATERRIRIPTSEPGKKPITIDIEPSDFRVPKLKLSDLLTLYKVSYTDTTDLEELEAAFWAAFLPNEPSESFDSDQYCHSPWFEKCCGERRSVKELKDRQDWDKIYLKWMPRKTVNLLSSNAKAGGDELFNELFTAACDNSPLHPTQITAAPTQIQVIHYDFDTIGVRLVDKPVYPADQVKGKFTDVNGNPMPPLPSDFLSEIKLMLLLKV
jgi:hypothetical protein